MGTTWAVTLNAPGAAAADRAHAREAIEARLDAVNDAMSTWQAGSELSRFNAYRGEEAFPLSPDTVQVLELARQVSRATGGAFDPTVRPLVAAWGFGAGARAPGDAPAEAEVAALREHVGFERLELDRARGSARKRDPQLELDLSAIAKGHAVDRVAEALEALGFMDFLVEVGGEVKARGQRPGGGSWRLGVERPEAGGRAVHGVVKLHDLAMATSGDYRSFYEAGGERRTHIVDPRSGRTVSHGLASVSVVHELASLADAWATALMVLGPDEGYALAEAQGLGAYFISRSEGGRTDSRATPAFPPIELRGAAEPE